jgi:superfamily II DNA or RNA helicase
LPRIFDNIEQKLLPALIQSLQVSERADFCVGYFNLRGWKLVANEVDKWQGTEQTRCRVLVGMQALPQDLLKESYSLTRDLDLIDQTEVNALRKRAALEFREQLTFGTPTNDDERALRLLRQQLQQGKVIVKLFLKHRLHAKLYLAYRQDPNNPIVGFLGSSNLTFPGLASQGELNVDVLDHDACTKLTKWFGDRWAERWALDITQDLIAAIEDSWAREIPIPPYHVYLKMAFHLAEDARAGLQEFRLPRDMRNVLLDFQSAAVRIAAHHLNRRGGVLLGDVVGLGKTLMATALARVFQDDQDARTLILCPPNLVKMWQSYVEEYSLHAKIVPFSTVARDLPTLRRYTLVLIDESHNLRNREGRAYRAIRDYIAENDSRCILLSATPYNKAYIDISSQLRLFIDDDKDLGIRPERKLRELGETNFIRLHQCPIRSIRAFEQSEHPDDWRDLMRLYMVRRTRSFIVKNYAKLDPISNRPYLEFPNGNRFYFPDRVPRTIKYGPKLDDESDVYGRMQSVGVVTAVTGLRLPRYGLGNYINTVPALPATPDEARIILGLSRAGQRLIGFCRTNLFKRLESGGPAFIQSLERHILRNYVFLHAIANDLPLPVGSQSFDLPDEADSDEDEDSALPLWLADEDDAAAEADADPDELTDEVLQRHANFTSRATTLYTLYQTKFRRRFKWIRSSLFTDGLREALQADIDALSSILSICTPWNPDADDKLIKLLNVLKKHANEKVLIFTQFADTADYLVDQLRRKKVKGVEKASGRTGDPTTLAWRFSPISNDKPQYVGTDQEIRVLVSTDVLSEGQNLQDSHIVVNFDLPWALVRLIQRAGRVDRIGQESAEIYCYSFLPTAGVERIISLRSRVRTRLREHAEVVGTDEVFFEGDAASTLLVDLYHEKSGALDEKDNDTDVDLASYAYQIWKNAIDEDPKIEPLIKSLENVVYSAKSAPEIESGALTYARMPDGTDSLAHINSKGEVVTDSPLSILRAAACSPDTPAVPRSDDHHELVRTAVLQMLEEETRIGGNLGRPSGARFRTFERLNRYADEVAGTLLETPELLRAVDDIYRYPLKQTALDVLNRQLKAGVDDIQLANLVTALRTDNRLCAIEEREVPQDPQIICSLGLRP